MRSALLKGRSMACKMIVAVAVAISCTMYVSTADARAKKKIRYYSDGTTRLSLDGRNTGRARTCGFSTFVYDNRGVPTGPYCH